MLGEIEDLSSLAGLAFDEALASDGAGGAPGNEDMTLAAAGAGGIICNPAICGSSCWGGTTNRTLSGGSASAGGNGGMGGTGSGAAGGGSFAIVRVGTAVIDHGPDTTLAHGSPGDGGNGANTGPAGISGDVYP